MLKIEFIFIGEGTSDDSFIALLEELCRLSKKIGHKVSQKAKAALDFAPNTDLLFIHRDADGRDPTPRYEEIAQAIESLGVSIPYVAVVPVQETEAWLLLDEEAIQYVVKKSKGRMRLNLPSPKQVENIAKPKERLKELLARASGLKGRRLKNFNKKFPQHRRKLLENLDCSGPVSEVPAFKRLVDEIAQAIEKLKR